MSGVSEFHKLMLRTSEKYIVREFPECFIVSGNNGSVVVYGTKGNSTRKCTVCFGEQREYGEGKELDEIIDRFCK